MLRRVVFAAILAFGVLVIIPSAADGACNAWLSCPSSCSIELICPNQCSIYCFNIPTPPSVSCSGNSSCSVGEDSVTCDGTSHYCAPYICTQGETWVQCNNNEIIYCPGPGEYCT